MFWTKTAEFINAKAEAEYRYINPPSYAVGKCNAQA